MSKERKPLYAYRNLMHTVMAQGKWVHNERTGKDCLTLINQDLEYNVEAGEFPLDTTRKSYWRVAIDEMCAYLRGYDNLKQLHEELGVKVSTWDGNANAKSWLESPYHTGEEGDLGRIYGVQGNDWKSYLIVPTEELSKIDKLVKLGWSLECTTTDNRLVLVRTTNQLRRIFEMLQRGEDDRGLILNFYNPGETDQGCLRPCMYNHHFSLIGKDLYLNSIQRSADLALGCSFNMVQVYFLLYYFAWALDLNPKTAYHKLVNCHYYEDQVDTVLEQLEEWREPLPHPIFKIKDDIPRPTTFEEFLKVDSSWFEVTDYEYHPAIQHAFTV